ncbi:MAG: NAD(P)-binding protein [Aquabacterium sp.]
MISRRDFLNGMALPVGATLPGWAGAAPATVQDPPARTGLQGHTDDRAAVAHQLRDPAGAARLRDGVAERDDGIEDLVVVGAGLSGLAGAHLFVQHAGRPVRVLLLEALDDFGGHARRNEFTAHDGRRLVGYGGSQSLDSPGQFSPAVHALLAGIGIELQRFDREFHDHGWAQRHGVARRGLFFGRAAWGEDRLVVRGRDEPPAQWLSRTPLAAAAQADWARLLAAPGDLLPGRSRAARRLALSRMTYRDFLHRHARVHEDVQRVLWQDTLGYFAVGSDAISALDAYAAGQPGFKDMDLGDEPDALMSPSGRLSLASSDKYIYHFPDGNHGVARALLRALRPALVPGTTMESLADARVDYAALDAPDAAVRLRLSATVVGLRHLGPPDRAERVALRYVDARGVLREVQARQVLLACWHRVIARLTDELPAAQSKALDLQVKTPMVYANALLRSGEAWARAGIGGLKAVQGFWNLAQLDFPVSMGGVRFAASPAEPLLVHLAKVVATGDGRPPREQAMTGRAQLLQWPFSHFEAETRALLQGALGPHGFDHRRDIEAITVNRWSHGYADEYLRPWDAGFWPGGALPCETARRGWGRVAIANSDAGAYAYAHSAIDQATRAVAELLPQAQLPAWSTRPGPYGFKG